MGVLSRLESKVAEMTARLDGLAESGIESWVEELAALHALQVQELLDMILRLAAELGYAPESIEGGPHTSPGRVLDDQGYDLVKRIIGFRNILVHEHAQINMNLVRSML